MPGKQVRMFVPLLCRSDTAVLGAEIQAPISSPTHHAQPAASVAAAGGDMDPVVVGMVLLDTRRCSNPLPLLMPGWHQQDLGQCLGPGGIS